MVGRAVFPQSMILFSILVLVCCGGCLSGLDPLWGPPGYNAGRSFETVHIEQVIQPTAPKVGVAAQFTLHVSALANPQLLNGMNPFFYRTDSTSYSAGVTSGKYESGQFAGLYAYPEFSSGTNATVSDSLSVMTLTLTFTEPGRNVVYFGHNRNASEGGRAISLGFPGGNEYPAESDFIEYLKVVVDVQP